MRKEYFGRFDFSQDPILFDPPEIGNTQRVGEVTLDGKPILSAWYGDTNEGIVKTFDVLHNGAVATPTAKDALGKESWTPEDFPGREVECPYRGVLSETLRGHVQIWGPEEGRK